MKYFIVAAKWTVTQTLSTWLYKNDSLDQTLYLTVLSSYKFKTILVNNIS